MEDVFGDPLLFGEFEKDCYSTERSAGEGARAFLSSLRNSLKENTSATENGVETTGDAQMEIETSSMDRENFPDTISAMEYIKKLEDEIQQLKKINDKLLHQNRLINPKSLDTTVDRPAVQVLFMNNVVARKYRSKIENCLRSILLEGTEELFRESRMPCVSEVVGSCHYFRSFVLDVTGWPLPDHQSALSDNWNLPKYEQFFRQSLPCEKSDDKEMPEAVNKEKRSKAACFNCGGEHNVSACLEKRDQQKINLARRQFMDKFSPSVNNSSKQRYHIEDDPRFSEMRPGTISDNLREALGISIQQLPPYIYQMRVLGYPPGHLENAKQLTSGLTMFDKHGQELTSDGELLEDGEVSETLVQSAEYNLDELVEYPGFNINLPEGMIDECQRLGMPPMQPQWSKNVMKDFLVTQQRTTDSAKRKLDNSSYGDVSKKYLKTDVELETTVDMDIDETTAGDEMSEQFLTSSWPIVSMPVVNTPPPPPPPPPLPEDLEEELPPLPSEPSPGSSPTVQLDVAVERLAQSSTALETMPAVETKASPPHTDSSLNLPPNCDQVPKALPDSTVGLTTLKATKIVTPGGGRFGGSRSFCLGTPLALPLDDLASANDLPDARKFATGVSDLILHDNLPNATGTFNKLKVVLNELKNRSSPNANAQLKRQ